MSSLSLHDYCRILGVSEQATLNEIKQAYRRKAVVLHPDVNKAPDAHEKFLALVEAYQFLVAWKTGKKTISSTQRPTPQTDVYWQEMMREEARRKAREYAEMRYNEFRSSRGYRGEGFDFLGHFSFFFYCGAILLMPLILYALMGSAGLIVAGCILLITSPITVGVIRSRPALEMKKFFGSLKEILFSKYFGATLIFIFNIVIFFTVDLRTVIDISWFFILFVGVALAGYLVGQVHFRTFRWKKNSAARNVFHGVCLGPLTLHLAILLNFSYSRYPVKETLSLNNYTWYYNTPGTSDVLEHENENAYSGITLYINYHYPEGARVAICTFRTGLLGIPVLSEYYYTT